ncbi:hypothetical protein Trydic_g7445 [Trypoxylus dichotomus]
MNNLMEWRWVAPGTGHSELYMEFLESRALDAAAQKRLCWYRYVHDTFVVWPHGADALGEFLQHLNSIHPRIQFTMELEKDGQLPFLGVLVNRNRDGALGHRVYRKPTHTDRYLHYNSNHHPKQKRAVIKMLVDRAARICEHQHIEQELQHLNQALQANGYENPQVKRAMRPSNSKRTADEHQPSRDWQTTAYLPYIKSVTDRIGKTHERHNIKTIYKPTQQLCHQLRSAKDPRNPLTSIGVYRIPCSCGLLYISTTKRNINTRLKEHKRNCRLGQTDKSAVAEHALQDGDHNINFANTEVLFRSFALPHPVTKRGDRNLQTPR